MSLDTPQAGPRLERLSPHEARERLEHERTSRATQLQAIDETGPDTEEGVMSAQKDTIQRVLTEIEAALARVEDGSYGICRSCSEPIPVERLEILPYTPYCVPCQRNAA
ncbi:TraR/DksA C4-type zinc finger protein [Streptomyces kunmingensis]|uniref:TraR/DksA C4-type zinc finger protein n=1 Tax=Streptomyces kunmingensis TaxID=68225 RepID=A0ABU6CG19_9ACTN|nr:TraR/DksA C4-type zinc finger protein [Streptomyces kunmingensis]MEB3963315.1 TraR/DksA C4-type zinc finger protein [Streptomyces kunmingensis]